MRGPLNLQCGTYGQYYPSSYLPAIRDTYTRQIACPMTQLVSTYSFLIALTTAFEKGLTLTPDDMLENRLTDLATAGTAGDSIAAFCGGM